ncbi:MAG: response regulator [Chloroflexi bacterium]|nr:response regulator [Chloroflexota bacterium]
MNTNCILLVEDNPSDVELTRRALDQITNNIAVVKDGQEALDYLFGEGAYTGRATTDLPALVLLDLKLPRLSGLEVLKRIRADLRTRRLVVIMLSSSRQEEDVIASYELGVNSYIRKPVNFADFTEAIRLLGLYWLEINEPPPPTGR